MVREAGAHDLLFDIDPEDFRSIPGMSFAYWTEPNVRSAFKRHKSLKSHGVIAASGASSKDDEQFLRLAWEVDFEDEAFPALAKGGKYSPYYADIYLRINWRNSGREIKEFVEEYRRSRGFSPHWTAALLNANLYFRPGLTWSRRTQGGFSLRAMPRGCVFADKGPAAFVAEDEPETLLALLALANSEAFRLLVSLQMAFGSYEVGVIQKTPLPDLSADQKARLAALAHLAWSKKRALDTVEETSRAFLLPSALRARLHDYVPADIEAELAGIQVEIDVLASELYGFSKTAHAAADAGGSEAMADETEVAETVEDDADDDDINMAIDQTSGLLSWAVGVAFGRFDHRLATGKRAPPSEPLPFDPLPIRSPGMLPNGDAPIHGHASILVDDPGHLHDLSQLVEDVLLAVDTPVPQDVRRWLQREFFQFHLQLYSKSRRKAPIYWPLATLSSGYILWLYLPQTKRPNALYRRQRIY